MADTAENKSGTAGETSGDNPDASKVAEGASTEEKKFTQKDIDAAVQARHNRDKDNYTKLETEFASFKSSVGNIDELKKSVETLEEEKNELASTKTALELELLRVKIAYNAGLSEKSFKFLSGNTEDEIKANAEELKELQGPSEVRVGSISSKDYDGANAGIRKKSPYDSVLSAD